MATDTNNPADREPRPRYRWLWFAGLYVASIATVAGAVYGLKFLIDWIVVG
jgi:hypothetical protein